MVVERLDEHVMLELDTYWAAVGGADTATVLRGLGGRARFVHVKDGPLDPAEPMTAVGAGRIDVVDALTASDAVAWHIVEIDRVEGDMRAAVVPLPGGGGPPGGDRRTERPEGTIRCDDLGIESKLPDRGPRSVWPLRAEKNVVDRAVPAQGPLSTSSRRRVHVIHGAPTSVAAITQARGGRRRYSSW